MLNSALSFIFRFENVQAGAHDFVGWLNRVVDIFNLSLFKIYTASNIKRNVSTFTFKFSFRFNIFQQI